MDRVNDSMRPFDRAYKTRGHVRPGPLKQFSPKQCQTHFIVNNYSSLHFYWQDIATFCRFVPIIYRERMDLDVPIWNIKIVTIRSNQKTNGASGQSEEEDWILI